MDKVINFKGEQCYYKIAGKGRAIMLVHGFIEEGSMWDEGIKAFQKKFKVIVPDLPGFGKSPLPSNINLTMEWYAEYLNEILKQEKIKQVILLGHSMGGYIALHFAEKYGSKLLAFGLVNSHCFEDTEEKKANRKKGIEFIGKNGSHQFVTELYNNIFHESFKKKHRKLIDELITKAMKYTPEALMMANAAMMNRRDKSLVLKNSKVPVLFINGKEDDSAPLAYTLKQATMPAIADVHFFSHCKHMCIFERKTATIHIIEEFCSLV